MGWSELDIRPMVIHCIYGAGSREEGRAVIKKLTKHGNSYALVIDKPILDLLGIDAETPLELKTNGSGLWIEPVISDERRREIERIREKIHGKNGDVFKRLAE